MNIYTLVWFRRVNCSNLFLAIVHMRAITFICFRSFSYSMILLRQINIRRVNESLCIDGPNSFVLIGWHFTRLWLLFWRMFHWYAIFIVSSLIMYVRIQFSSLMLLIYRSTLRHCFIFTHLIPFCPSWLVTCWLWHIRGLSLYCLLFTCIYRFPLHRTIIYVLILKFMVILLLYLRDYIHWSKV